MAARRHWSRSPSNDRNVAVERIYVTRPAAAQLGPRGAHLERWAVQMGHHPEVDTLTGPNPKAGRAHASVLFLLPIPWCNHAFFSSIVEVTRSCHGPWVPWEPSLPYKIHSKLMYARAINIPIELPLPVRPAAASCNCLAHRGIVVAVVLCPSGSIRP
ncbi:hypothetical protein ABZP36_018941 [Zizania latifolia]